MRNTLFLTLLIFALALSPARAQSPVESAAEDAVGALSEYLKIDNSNPPGNEMAACRFIEKKLAAAGIPCTIWEAAPGRGNLYAVLRGRNPKLGSLMLLSHSDVVPADARYWTHPPFSGAIADGQIYGRGAIDMKGMGIVQMEAFIALARARIPLERDVVLLVVADEEMAATAGVRWLMKNQPQLFENVAGVLNEEGPGLLEGGRVKYWEVRPGQKGIAWLQLIAKGQPGHGSLPYRDAAPNRLIRALERVLSTETPVKVLPEAQQFFRQVAALEPDPKRAEQLRDVQASLTDPAFSKWFFSNRMWNAMVRNTISLTQLEGSNKTNVIPPQATAAIDCRILPGDDTAAFIERIRALVAPEGVEVVGLDVENAVKASSIDTDLFRCIHDVIQAYFPGTLVVTPYSRAANDSRYFQEKGIVCYGLTPFALTQAEIDTQHGNDERVSVENVKRGVHMIYDIVKRFASR